MNLVKRILAENLLETIKTRALTYLSGGRQVGKSTLCDQLANIMPVNKISFDSPLIMAAAKTDPASFIKSLPHDKLNYIDEVQKVPELFPYYKIYIDEQRAEGVNKSLLLLTGSANLMALPTLSEALVGRMSVLTLYPLSVCEAYNKTKNIIKRLFNEPLIIEKYDNYDIIDAIQKATYPEIALNDIDRTKWFDDYLTTILNRDIKSLSDLRNPEKMIMLLSVLSMRVGGLLNNAAVASEIGLDYKTYEKFFALALNTFLIFTLKPWSMPNKLNKRFTKSPKLYFTDCNMLAYIIKRDIKDIFINDKTTFGHILENFIVSELLKNCTYHNVDLFYFRTTAGKEVDFVLQNKEDIIGIEVKSSATVDKKETKGLEELKNLVGNKFKRGIVFYLGSDVFPLAPDIYAVPISYLWK